MDDVKITGKLVRAHQQGKTMQYKLTSQRLISLSSYRRYLKQNPKHTKTNDILLLWNSISDYLALLQASETNKSWTGKTYVSYKIN